MTVAVAELDELRAARAAELLRACCGAARWVAGMVARRPFHTLGAVLDEADDLWWSLGPDDWLEALAQHPRIGERHDAGAQDPRGAAWSAGEQSGVDVASADVRAALAAVNGEYERRFRHTYVVCATGKSAEEMLALARARLGSDPETELRVAAGEQLKITRLRLEKLLADDPHA